MSRHTFSAEEEIKTVRATAPHLVLLGAGASRAAFPNGERNGKKLPLMDDFIDCLGLASLLEKFGVKHQGQNFEDIYSSLCNDASRRDLLELLEHQIYSYFEGLRMPDYPTIYDYLVLSLRQKDFIATFNWDPFLVQAVLRNGHRFRMPQLLFLHGNVAVGHCTSSKHRGKKGQICPHCGSKFTQSKLLYPIKEKNYQSDPFIVEQWQLAADVLKTAPMFTVYGYGAPGSDVEAMKLMGEAWGPKHERLFDHVEVIDILPESSLYSTWSPFIHNYHFKPTADFFSSWIAEHPRRTIEAHKEQHLENRFVENNPLPQLQNFDELWNWYDKLAIEEAAENDEIDLLLKDSTIPSHREDDISVTIDQGQMTKD